MLTAISFQTTLTLTQTATEPSMSLKGLETPTPME